mgnify:CR=1 FL=1
MEKTFADLEVKRDGLKTEIDKNEKLKNEIRKKTEELGPREEKAKATLQAANDQLEKFEVKKFIKKRLK